MPTIASVTVRFGRKYQIRRDDWVGLEAIVTLSVSEAEAAQVDPASVTTEAFTIAKASVIEQRAELRRELQEAQARAIERAEPVEPPRTSAEAEQRFFARYGAIIGGRDWGAAQRYLQTREPKPTNIAGWLAVARAVRDSGSCSSQAHNQEA
jgi:hypothetical protein